MCSNDVLKERIDNLTKNMAQFHSDFKDFAELERIEHEKIFQKFENQEKKYVLRREMQMLKWVWWILLWATSAFSAVMALFNK